MHYLVYLFFLLCLSGNGEWYLVDRLTFLDAFYTHTLERMVMDCDKQQMLTIQVTRVAVCYVYLTAALTDERKM